MASGELIQIDPNRSEWIIWIHFDHLSRKNQSKNAPSCKIGPQNGLVWIVLDRFPFPKSPNFSIQNDPKRSTHTKSKFSKNVLKNWKNPNQSKPIQNAALIQTDPNRSKTDPKHSDHTSSRWIRMDCFWPKIQLSGLFYHLFGLKLIRKYIKFRQSSCWMGSQWAVFSPLCLLEVFHLLRSRWTCKWCRNSWGGGDSWTLGWELSNTRCLSSWAKMKRWQGTCWPHRLSEFERQPPESDRWNNIGWSLLLQKSLDCLSFLRVFNQFQSISVKITLFSLNSWYISVQSSQIWSKTLTFCSYSTKIRRETLGYRSSIDGRSLSPRCFQSWFLPLIIWRLARLSDRHAWVISSFQWSRSPSLQEFQIFHPWEKNPLLQWYPF